MKVLFRFFVVLVAVVTLAAACGGDDGSIEVEDARYRLGRSDLGAGYMSLTNTTGEDVRLEAASAEGVGRIELHETTADDDGVMSMAEVPDGFVIASGQTVTLQPGGKHLMIFDPEGTEDLTVTLDFGDETIEVVAVYDAEASAAAMEMDGMDHGGDDMDDMDMDETDAMDDMEDTDS